MADELFNIDRLKGAWYGEYCGEISFCHRFKGGLTKSVTVFCERCDAFCRILGLNNCSLHENCSKSIGIMVNFGDSGLPIFDEKGVKMMFQDMKDTIEITIKDCPGRKEIVLTNNGISESEQAPGCAMICDFH